MTDPLTEFCRAEYAMTKKNLVMPGWPRGLSREFAAAYIGVSASLFNEMVSDGRMPPAKQINRRKVWDVREVDLAFTKLGVADGPTWSAFEIGGEADLGPGPASRRFGDHINGKVSPASQSQKWCPPQFEKYRGEEWFASTKFYKEGEWEALVRSRPLNRREKIGLEGYFRGKGQHKLQVKGASINTIDLLVIRGYIEIESERGEGKVPYYGITVSGEEAWRELEGSDALGSGHLAPRTSKNRGHQQRRHQ
jgi:hypothetical protein